jgi:Astacin (Peptidase family M12A)
MKSRTDRDSAVRINFNNVQESMKSQYRMLNVGFYHSGYDIYSIMQYPSGGFAINKTACTEQGVSGCRDDYGCWAIYTIPFDHDRLGREYDQACYFL